jgi:lipopolysaccharide/colanic/teichoic acid biosynthesis glycosyltransferase
MVVNADKVGPAITTSGDTRITPIGNFLRRTKLDELPQFLNVVRGEMSVVGPRPEDPRYVKLYTPEQRAVLNVRPGITSPASVQYRYEEAQLAGPNWETQYINDVLPSKLAIDLDYVRKPGVARDISVLWQTARAVLN